MSVDTHLKGKNTSPYRRVHQDDITILVAKPLLQHASKVELVARRRLFGHKLVAVAHHQHGASCRLHH